MQILFIENHVTFANTVVRTFLNEYKVVTVPSINSAIKKLQSEIVFDIALIDYDLDDGKGDKLTKIIKHSYPKVKIIATSSHSNGNSLIKSAGADAICEKMDFRNIKSVINSLF